MTTTTAATMATDLANDAVIFVLFDSHREEPMNETPENFRTETRGRPGDGGGGGSCFAEAAAEEAEELEEIGPAPM